MVVRLVISTDMSIDVDDVRLPSNARRLGHARGRALRRTYSCVCSDVDCVW